jgi:hypothetical protein
MIYTTLPTKIKITDGICGNVACSAKKIPIEPTNNVAAMTRASSNICNDRSAKSMIVAQEIPPDDDPENALQLDARLSRLYVLMVLRALIGPKLMDPDHSGAATGGT